MNYSWLRDDERTKNNCVVYTVFAYIIPSKSPFDRMRKIINESYFFLQTIP